MVVTLEERVESLEERMTLFEARTLANHKLLQAISETQSEHTKRLARVEGMLGEILAILKGKSE